MRGAFFIIEKPEGRKLHNTDSDLQGHAVYTVNMRTASDVLLFLSSGPRSQTFLAASQLKVDG